MDRFSNNRLRESQDIVGGSGWRLDEACVMTEVDVVVWDVRVCFFSSFFACCRLLVSALRRLSTRVPNTVSFRGLVLCDLV